MTLSATKKQEKHEWRGTATLECYDEIKNILAAYGNHSLRVALTVVDEDVE